MAAKDNEVFLGFSYFLKNGVHSRCEVFEGFFRSLLIEIILCNELSLKLPS